VTETPAVPQPSVVSYSPATMWVIGLCFVLSGATGLIYEILWARMLGLVFGATTLAISTVLAAFMGGLALGSAIAGKLGRRIRKPLSTYGWMEIGIAIFALLVPFLFQWVDNIYAWIWQQFHPGFFAFSVWRFVLSSLLLLVPTTLMGATLPVLSAALVSSREHDSNAVTRLYSCNLLGAILGTLAAGFLLLPILGVRMTIVVAASINILVGIIAIVQQRKSVTVAETKESAEINDGPEIVEGYGFWLLAAFVSGFVTISTQVSWTRWLSMIIGSSTYAFSIVVSLFLIGLAGGAWIIGRSKSKEALRTTIIKVEIFTALAVFLSLFVVSKIPNLLVVLGLKLQVGSWPALLALQIMSAALLVLVPALLMGMVMPLVLVWAGSSKTRAVSLVGRSYAINTLGAIAGAFITGFILIPRTSAKFTIIVAAAMCVLVAGVAFKPAANATEPALRRALAIGAVPIVWIVLMVAAPSISLIDLSVGAYDSLIRVLAQTREGIVNETAQQSEGKAVRELLMYEEGPTSTVTVRRDQDTVSMAINGRTNASDSIYDMPTQVMLSQVPMLVAPKIGNGLIIGYATGVSVGSMLQSPIESVTCVELEPATVRGSKFFNHVNNQPLNDPRTHLIIDDARTILRVTPNRYDVIVSEPSHPWVPGVANLFTQEFFEMGRSRLSDQGVFVQWLQIYQLSTESLRSVLATYHKVFPHVLVFRVGGLNKGKDLILMGSNTPLNLDKIKERILDERIAKEIARVELKSEADVRSWFVCDEKKLGPAVAGAVINTDDNMHIETTVPKEAFRPLMQSNAQWIEALAK
jgi:spermidine synthase